jgi:hypothetical protein
MWLQRCYVSPVSTPSVGTADLTPKVSPTPGGGGPLSHRGIEASLALDLSFRPIKIPRTGQRNLGLAHDAVQGKYCVCAGA